MSVANAGELITIDLAASRDARTGPGPEAENLSMVISLAIGYACCCRFSFMLALFAFHDVSGTNSNRSGRISKTVCSHAWPPTRYELRSRIIALAPAFIVRYCSAAGLTGSSRIASRARSIRHPRSVSMTAYEERSPIVTA
jgi:hypothetical protein